MASNKKTDDKQPTNAGATQPTAVRQVVINAQYVKDLSFENPNSPSSLVPGKDAPKIDVSVDVKVHNLQKNSYEVILLITAKANAGENNLFLIELSYGSVFTIDVPEQELEPVLMIYCPGMVFPFARRIIADTVRDGGFPPLMLDPIDFASLYQQHKATAKASPKADK